MGWDKGRYYTRSKKVNGRVVREYIGAGQTAAVIARLDAHKRWERQIRQAILKEEQALLDGLDAGFGVFIDLTRPRGSSRANRSRFSPTPSRRMEETPWTIKQD